MGGTMSELVEIIERLKAIEGRLNDMEKKTHVICYLCKQYTNSYTTVEYGSKYDGEALCHECLDRMVGSQMQYLCTNCHKPLHSEQVITCSGMLCMECHSAKKDA